MPVIVTGVGGGGHGEQIVKALRLGELSYYIVGTDITALSAGRDSVDEFRIVPPASDPGYFEQIVGLARETRAKALFHGSELEMAIFSRRRAEIEAGGTYVPVNSPALLSTCQNKGRTMAFLEVAGFPAPAYRSIRSLEDLEGFAALPAILKPSTGGGGSANVFIAQDEEELRSFSTHLLTMYDEFLVQEYVGTPDEEYTVGVLFGADGKLLNSIAVKRVIGNALSVRVRVPNRTQRRSLGSTLVISSGISQGVVGSFPAVTEQCESIANALEPTAPLNIQCRLVGDEVMAFEINPRFSGTTSIRAIAGYNEPDVLVRRDVFGQRIAERFSYRECVVMRALHEVEV